MEVSERQSVHGLVMRNSISQSADLVDQIVHIGSSLWLEHRKRVTESVSPECVLVALAEQESPEAEWQFRDDAPGCLGLPVAAQPLKRDPDVRVPVVVEEAERVMGPLAWQAVAHVPGMELLVEGVAKHDLDVAEHLEEGGSDLSVPLIQEGGVEIASDRCPVWGQPFPAEVGPAAGGCDRPTHTGALWGILPGRHPGTIPGFSRIAGVSLLMGELAVWYVELAVLAVVKYDGRYRNRLSRNPQVGAVELVPWA